MRGSSADRGRSYFSVGVLLVCLLPVGDGAVLAFGQSAAATESPAGTEYFAIHVVDEQTGRGVPLVELKTVNEVRYYTDSAGWVASYEPGLMDREVFFHVFCHGYEYPADGFGYRGVRLTTKPGGEATVKIKRINIAERLYRITGGGVYRDSVLLGRDVPIENPVLNGDVLGQDSVQNVVYGGKLYWFWGDTGRPQYPLGNFHMAGATSALPSAGGLDPSVGVDLTYFVDENGFAKQMAPRPEPGPVWLDAFVTLADAGGRERMYAAYARVKASMEAVERGMMRYDDEQQVFEKVREFDLDAPAWPGGHPLTSAEGGVEYVWFAKPFPLVRVRATAEAYLDVGQYESWTPLVEGSTVESAEIARDAAGRVQYAWRRNTPALDQAQQTKLIEAGKLRSDEAWLQLQDVETGKPVMAHAGSVYWNAYRGRWITIRCEVFGSSMLGETWYAEADSPLGPWVYARKIVTHEQYTFYNPKQHPEFDQDDGRVIYFEGTYASTFSGNPEKTPRYDYNQMMYRLDLADERLVLPGPVYRLTEDGDQGRSLERRSARAGDDEKREIAFFALDRPREGAVAVRWSKDADGGSRLVAGSAGDARGSSAREESIAFYALATDGADAPPMVVPLYEFCEDAGAGRRYSTNEDGAPDGYRRVEVPVCRVWRSPYGAALRW